MTEKRSMNYQGPMLAEYATEDLASLRNLIDQREEISSQT